MDRAVDDTIHLAVELIICAIVIGAIAVVGLAGYKSYNSYYNSKHSSDSMQDMVEFYYYDNKVVSGSDITELMLRYTRDYDYYLYRYNSSGALLSKTVMSDSEMVRQNIDFKEYWSEKNVRSFVSGKEKLSFTSNIVKTNDGNSVLGFVFTITE